VHFPAFVPEKGFAKLQNEVALKKEKLRERIAPEIEAEVRKRDIKKEKVNAKELTPRALRRKTVDELLLILNSLEEDALTVQFIMVHYYFIF